MTSSQQDTTSSIAFPDNMRSCRSAQDTILTDQELLDTICRSNFGNQLHNFWVPVSSITSDDQEAVLDTLGDGKKNTGDEGFTVMRLLEDDDLFP